MKYAIITDDNLLLTINTERKTVTYYCKSGSEREKVMEHVVDVIEGKHNPDGVFEILECYYIVQYEVGFKQ